MRYYTNESFIESFEESLSLDYISDNLDEKFNDMINHFIKRLRIKNIEIPYYRYYCKKDLEKIWKTYNNNKETSLFIFYSEIIKRSIYNLQMISNDSNKDLYNQYKYEFDNRILIERKEKIEKIKKSKNKK